MDSKTIQIAVILTCHNRKVKTLMSLQSLFVAQEYYNSDATDKIELEVFLTDDGCTDGTTNAILTEFKNRSISIIKGSGSLYWAGGMRRAWHEALIRKTEWSFYLLLNDDTIVKNNVFEELFKAHAYSLSEYGKPGIYSGITCDVTNPNVITYSGDRFNSKAKAKWTRLGPTGFPQLVDQTNANILLVSPEVVKVIGVFHNGYTHSCADYDYCMQARKNGIPALITANVCGCCKYDHLSDGDEALILMKMSLGQRIRYVYSPTHSDKDYLLYVRRNIPAKFPISWGLRKVRMLFPWLYYKINMARGVNGYQKLI